MTRAAALAALAAVLPGCVGLGSGDGTCVDDQACDAGSVCAFGLCVDANDRRLDNVDLEVEPDAASGLPVQSVFDVDASVADGARVDIALRPAVNVRGTVVGDDGGVPARVIATPARFIAGRARLPSTTTSDGAWSLALVDGATWRLAAIPENPALPPVVADVDTVAGVDDAPPLVIADDVVIDGRVVAGEGAASIGVPDLEVRVVDGDGRRVSSLGRTDADGHFSVALPQRLADVVLEILPTEQNATGAPRLALPLDVDADTVALGDISLGDISGPVPVTGRAIDDNGAPASGATVIFRGLVGAGTYVARTTCGDDGSFSVALLRGDYATAVVADVEESAGLRVDALSVTGPVEDLLLTLSPRIAARLTVRSSDGRGVAGASVVLQRVGDVFGLGEPVLDGAQPVFLASTDDDGAASVRVDAGRYRVNVQPPRGTGAPAFSALLTIDADVERVLTLPRSTVLAGQLTGPGGPTSGALVRVFSTLHDELGRAIFLGEALSESDGSFAVAVPDLTP